MAVDLNELLTRVGEIQAAALAALATPIVADSKPYFIYTQESFPYITQRIGDIQIDFDSEDMDRYVVTVISRLVIGHATAGYMGINESDLYRCIPAIIHAINDDEGLVSTSYPAHMTQLIEATENRMRSCAGFRVFMDGGLKDVKQVGTEFTATYLFDDDL